jgi:4-amino-4-deoxy-L-arabinose transferase-like glycosyltransferase
MEWKTKGDSLLPGTVLPAKNVSPGLELDYNVAQMLDKTKRWIVAHPYWLLTFVTVAVLAPFLAKPFNIDDPLFIWAAKQIRAHPLNPYGFNVEWGWTAVPMWKVTQNPPLACYFIALSSLALGWSEIGLHLAFLLPAIAVILGTYRLAKNFCGRPLLATLITLFTPVFMVSSLTVMCDVTMLSFWIWALVFWIEGVEQEKTRKLIIAGILIALAAMTKYYGACLIPLLAAHGLSTRRPFKQWGPALLIPIAVLCAYQSATGALYGEGLLNRAAEYTSFSKMLFGFSKLQNGLIALSFTGGCVASAVLFIPLLWQKRKWIMPAIGLLSLAVIFFPYTTLWEKYPALQGTTLAAVKIQMIFWATGGLCVLGLAAVDIFRQRDSGSLLLLLWVAGTFAFAAFCNWTINARSILPLAPAAAILVARRLEIKSLVPAQVWPPTVIACLLASFALSWSVTRADCAIAGASRQGAQEVCNKYHGRPGTLWFQGHWGFQYYMEQFGASMMDFIDSRTQSGDLLVVPQGNTNTRPPDPQTADLLTTFAIPGARWLTTFNANIGGSFYASAIAPLPFAFGPVPPDKVSVYALKFSPEQSSGNVQPDKAPGNAH